MDIKDAVTSITNCLSDINFKLSSYKPISVVVATFFVTLLLRWIVSLYLDERGLSIILKAAFFKIIRKIPYVQRQFDSEFQNFFKIVQRDFNLPVADIPYVRHLPPHGMSQDDILALSSQYFKAAKQLKGQWEEGKHSGAVYNGADDITELITQIYRRFAWTNPLHADAFPDVRKMEAEIVRITCNLFNGDKDSCGVVTAGGTESIMLACKAYRDYAAARGITQPVMIVPQTAHAAFDKAGHYFNIVVKSIPVDPDTYAADVRAMKDAITRNTCVLVASAPEFAHGIVDPVEDIAQLGLKYNIPVHVDICLGSYIIPHMEKAGFPIAPVDFRLEGVTSISCDTHKYGFAPKGTSVVMYRQPKYIHHQYYATADWPGGLYATQTFAGSRSGAVIAACWATLLHFGEDGYVDSCRRIVFTTRYIVRRLSNTPGLFVLGDPHVSVVAFSSLDFNIYDLQDLLNKKYGYHLSVLINPPALHLCVTLIHTQPGVADEFCDTVATAAAELLHKSQGYGGATTGNTAALYGTVAKVPDRGMVNELMFAYLDAYYSTDSPQSEDCNGNIQ